MRRRLGQRAGARARARACAPARYEVVEAYGEVLGFLKSRALPPVDDAQVKHLGAAGRQGKARGTARHGTASG